jgi:long-chain acyl-CoA synthetase
LHTIKHCHAGDDHDDEEGGMNLSELAQQHGDRPALVIDEAVEVLTYGALDDASIRFARAFADLGLGPGDGVAAILDNSARVAELWWAALRSGLYYTPVNWHLTATEVSWILQDSGARVLVVDVAHVAVAREAVRGLDVAVVALGETEGCLDLTALAASMSGSPLAHEPAGSPMFYSSGTTGRPRGIRPRLSGRDLREGTNLPNAIMRMYDVPGDAVYLSPGPLYHSSPSLWSFGMHTIGATAVVMSRFDAATAVRLIEGQRVTHSQWVPTMFSRMLELPEAERLGRDLSSHRVAYHAAAPCPVPVKRAMIEWWGPILTEFYAATEGGTTLISSAEWLDRPGSVGRAWSGGEVHVLDPVSHEEQPAGTPGLIYFKRLADLRFEYHNDPEKTAAVHHGDLVTAGDIGYLDDEGYLFLTDRQSDMIISGGVNIYPREIEHVLLEHPDIRDAAVFGVPDPDFGESVHAVVEVAPGTSPGADDIRAWCRERLAGFKTPRSVEIVTELPRDPNGKLYKRRLKERHWLGHSNQLV